MNALVAQGPNSPESRRANGALVIEIAARHHDLATEFVGGLLRLVGDRAASR
jgi:hypothetical protein